MSELFPPLLFPPERGSGAMTLMTFGLRVVGGKEEEKPKRICQRRESSSTFILPSINIQVCQTFLGRITTVTMVTLMMLLPQARVSRFRTE